MKLHLKYSLFAAFFAVALPAFGTVSLEFSNGGPPVWASGFANASGVRTNGMSWGIVVDTSGNGFAGSSTGYNADATPNAKGFLSVGGVVTDDYFLPASSFLGVGDPNLLTQDSTGAGGNGAAGTIVDTFGTGTGAGISVTGGSAIAAGEKFALVWFATNSMTANSNYGLLPEANFILPPDGTALADFSSDFTGSTGPYTANLKFTASGVPEPTSSMLALVGFAGLFLCRRRV